MWEHTQFLFCFELPIYNIYNYVIANNTLKQLSPSNAMYVM